MSEMKFSDWYIVNSPKVLADVYGQDTIVNYIKSKQKSREFDKSTFLMGRFGSGKTVLAKIMAKSIACRNINANGEPCENCPTCNAVNNETYDRDIIYLNGEQMSAADVDNILDKSFVTPAIRDAAKVFIVDETQGLSSAAIQKFLSATQSPKSGFFFIFTAMSKLAGKNPGALQSRCKNWKMKEPKNEEIYLYLGSICTKKKLQCTKEFLTEGLKFIAENSESSYRKAIQMLEQCYEGKIFTIKEIKETFAIESYEDAAAVLSDISHGKITEGVFNVIMGNDYQDKFGLLLKIIGDASTFRTFGFKFIDDAEKWKWKLPAEIAAGQYFDGMANAFLELADKAYLKRGEYQLVISNLLYNITKYTPPGITIKSDSIEIDATAVIPGKVVRRKQA